MLRLTEQVEALAAELKVVQEPLTQIEWEGKEGRELAKGDVDNVVHSLNEQLRQEKHARAAQARVEVDMHDDIRQKRNKTIDESTRAVEASLAAARCFKRWNCKERESP